MFSCQVISSFDSGWNNHSLRTEGNQTPNRIWLGGIIDKINREQHQIVDISKDDLEWFGMGWGVLTLDYGLSTVEIDDIGVPITKHEEIFQDLNLIDPLK